MKNKKTILIAGGIIIFAALLILVITMYRDKQNTKNNMESINKNYQSLTVNVTKYNEIRTKYSSLSSVLIMDSYDKKHEEITALLNEYNDVMKKIDNNIININLRCKGLYNDIEINKICNSYKVTYEKIVNLYVDDLKQYNDFIVKYNEYKMKELPVIDMVHEEYIDYNNDTIFEGSSNNEDN